MSDVAWEGQGAYVASASDDRTLRLWDVASGQTLRVLAGHTNFVFCCNFNPQGNLLVSYWPDSCRGSSFEVYYT